MADEIITDSMLIRGLGLDVVRGAKALAGLMTEMICVITAKPPPHTSIVGAARGRSTDAAHAAKRSQQGISTTMLAEFGMVTRIASSTAFAAGKCYSQSATKARLVICRI